MWKINEIEAESKLEEWSSVIRDLDSNRVTENHTHIQVEEKLTAFSKWLDLEEEKGRRQ